jgi:uncharacterized membrane protein
MGFLILFIALMLCALIVVVAFVKLAEAIFNLIVASIKLVWALATGFDKLAVRTYREYEVEAESNLAEPPAPVRQDVRLVASYGQRTGS